MRVIISGGGTGGHVFPAIAIADALKSLISSVDILFVGAKDKLEMEKVPAAGYKIEGLWISGIDRKFSMRNLVFPLKLLSSLWNADRIIKDFRPDVAVGVGGYASGPLLYRANARKIPTLIQEQNSYAGITNKLLAAKADKICVAYNGMEKFFPADKLVHLGNPVRKNIYANQLDSRECKERLGLPSDNLTILVVGGSLGARSINEAIEAGKALLEARSDINLIWQVGKLYEKEFSRSDLSKNKRTIIRAFIEDMPTAYAASDVVICRAGALTIAELQHVGKPAILVPSPNVAEDHQTQNAKALSEIGAAMLIPDIEAKAKLLPVAIDLLDNLEQRQLLAENILKMKKEDAALKIAAEIIKLAT